MKIFNSKPIPLMLFLLNSHKKVPMAGINSYLSTLTLLLFLLIETWFIYEAGGSPFNSEKVGMIPLQGMNLVWSKGGCVTQF